jgi:predicted DNA-binding ribbon-helix-helix protein
MKTPVKRTEITRTSIAFEREQLKRLRHRAVDQNLSVSELIRRAIERDEPRKQEKSVSS